MEKYFDILKSVSLFDQISNDDLIAILNCMGVEEHIYKKGNRILMADDPVTGVGIVLSGTVRVVKDDILGNQSILTELSQGELFGEIFACAGVKKSPVTVQCVSDCEVLFIDFNKIITTCSSCCVFHLKLIENMLKLIAGKNLMLNQKLDVLSKRTIREKLMSYFLMQMDKMSSCSFTIPFTRYELADYLCVDRSAMSRELGKMRDEKILKFDKNKFELL